MEDEFCHSDKERKSCKSLPKLQGQHFPFLGGFNFKKKKKCQPLLPLLLDVHCFLGWESQWKDNQMKRLSLAPWHLSSHVPAQPSFTASFWNPSRNGSISIFNKGSWRGERQLKEAERGWSQKHWQSKFPFCRESSGGGKERQTET